MNITDYFTTGLKKTLRFRNNANLSYSGQWIQLFDNTIIDEFFVGDFMAAEYTICVDAGSINREIIKCLVVAGVDTANITIYGRVNLGNDLVNVTAAVDASKLSLIVSPIESDDSTVGFSVSSGSKCYYTAKYFYSVEQIGDMI
jgi:hypothetical protein